MLKTKERKNFAMLNAKITKNNQDGKYEENFLLASKKICIVV